VKKLWTEKWRPQTVDGYVFRDSHQKRQVEQWIKDRSIPHLILSGSAGVGKTTLAKILINQIGIEDADTLMINASRTNSVDDVRNKITNFVQMIPFGPFKVVLLDEGDYLSPASQAALRGVMEEYHSTARFVITCNYPNRIIPAIHSRCQGFHIEKIDQTEFTARAATILVEEQVDFDLDTLDMYVKATYPDLRKCINLLQQNVQDQILNKPDHNDSGEADWKFDMVKLFKASKITEARKLLCSKLKAEEFEEVYRFVYDNLDLFGDTDHKQDNAVLIIKQALVDHTMVADPEINFSATMIRLARNYQS
jgi:replication factor C small subunit